jgi:hypothetical protein
MNKSSDGIPEIMMSSDRSRRTTAEFCNEQHEGARCMLPKHHVGAHECLENKGLTRWTSTSERS